MDGQTGKDLKDLEAAGLPVGYVLEQIRAANERGASLKIMLTIIEGAENVRTFCFGAEEV